MIDSPNSPCEQNSILLLQVVIFLFEGEEECRTFTWLRFRPDNPSMPVDNTLDGCQPDAMTGEFSVSVQPLECTKELAGVSHIEAHTVVADKIN